MTQNNEDKISRVFAVMSSLFVVLALVGMGWRLGSRHEQLVVTPFEDAAQVVWKGGNGETLRVQATVCVPPESLEAFEGASLSIGARLGGESWPMGAQPSLLRDRMACVSLPPGVVEGQYALTLDSPHRERLQGVALRLEVVESAPLGGLDWVWCWLLLGAMGLRLGAWSMTSPPAADQPRLMWGNAHPAVGLLLFLGLQWVLGLGVMVGVLQVLGIDQRSALGMLAQSLVMVASHLVIVYGVGLGAAWEHATQKPLAAANLLLGMHAGRRGLRPGMAVFLGGCLGIGATVLLAVLDGPSETSTMQEVVRQPGMMVALAGMACLSPWYEELFFRGYIQGALQARAGVWAAATLSTVLFALVHVPQHLGYLWPVVPILAVSIGASVLRAYSGSTTTAFALHLGYNAMLVLPAMFAA